MTENKYKYFTVTTTSIVKAANISEAEKIANSDNLKSNKISGQLLFKDVDIERITAIAARKQIEN